MTQNHTFTVICSDRRSFGASKGEYMDYSVPCTTSNPGKNSQMRWYSGLGYNASNGSNVSPLYYGGLLSQNNSAIHLLSRDRSTNSQLYYEDPDGIDRRAMGAYADTNVDSLLGSVGDGIGIPDGAGE